MSQMIVEPVDRVINGITYRITPLGAEKGLELFYDVAAVVGPSIGVLAGASGLASKSLVDVVSSAIDPAQLEQAIAGLFQRLSKERLKALMGQMVAMSMVEREGNMVPLKAVYEIHFMGKVKDQMAFLVEALKVNLADFFK